MISKIARIIRSIFRNESNRGQRVKRLTLFIVWQMWKRTIKRPLIAKLDTNSLKFTLYPDCVTSSNVIYFRDAGIREIGFLRSHINGGVLIDIGANVGIVSLSLADKIEHIILFEPNPIAAERAKKNLTLNSINFEIYELAVSDTDGVIFLEDRGGPSGCNRTLKDPSITSYPVKKVHCISLDTFLKECTYPLRKISLIKIDVEGHESAVLTGMQKTLKNLRPSIIMFEYLQRTNFQEVQRILMAAGYKIYSLDDRNNLREVVNQPKPHQDLFAFPIEQQL